MDQAGLQRSLLALVAPVAPVVVAVLAFPALVALEALAAVAETRTRHQVARGGSLLAAALVMVHHKLAVPAV